MEGYVWIWTLYYFYIVSFSELLYVARQDINKYITSQYTTSLIQIRLTCLFQ